MRFFPSHVLVLAAFLVNLSVSVPAQSQEIKVVYQPARQTAPDEMVVYDDWTVSFNRRFNPEGFELHSTHHSSLASAQAAARRIIAWSNSMPANSEWRITVILIEGDPSYYKPEKGRQDDTTKGPFSPVTLLMAKAVVRIDEVLNQTRDVASAAGKEIPDAGQVLNEYRKTVENAYANAAEAKKGLLDLQAKVTKTEFDRMNRLVDDQMGIKAESFLQGQKVQATRLTMDDSRKSADEQQTSSDLLDRIAKSKDPDEQKKLVAELKTRQDAGEIRKAVVAEGNYQKAREEHSAAEGVFKDIKESLDANQKVQLEIVARLKSPSVPKPPVANTDWKTRLVGTWYSQINNDTYVIDGNGNFKGYSWTGRQDSAGTLSTFDSEERKFTMTYSMSIGKPVKPFELSHTIAPDWKSWGDLSHGKPWASGPFEIRTYKNPKLK